MSAILFSPGAGQRPEEGEEEEDELALLAAFSESIVGVQYYEGEVNNKEMVILEREPHNPYDRNAIRVDNVRGEKVGHIARTVAARLAPLIDNGLIEVEAQVPRGGQNRFKIPVNIYVFGDESNYGRVERALCGVGKPIAAQRGQAGAGNGAGPSSQGGASGSGSQAVARLSQEAVARQVDALLGQMLGGDGEAAQEVLAAAAEIRTPLYRHQGQALAWMARRENSGALPPLWAPRLEAGSGGISYINAVTNFAVSARPDPLRGGILADDMGLGKTLVVLALIATNRPGAALQYSRPVQEEAAEGSEPSAKRAKKDKAPKQPKPTKAAAAEAEAARLAAAAAPPEAPPPAGSPRGTLIVCPLSVLDNWRQQLEAHTAGGLSLLIYHGADRDRRPSALAAYDLVITTYGTLAAELGARNGMVATPWLRVVLDEAHNVKNPGTKAAQAARALRARFRWALTGTPIPNGLPDLHGLLRFLKLDPLEERKIFRQGIERPVKEGDALGIRRLQALMHSVALRRTKETRVNGAPLVSLPTKSVFTVHVRLDPASRTKYRAWEEAGRGLVATLLSSGELLRNYSAVLEVLLRLRQICNHPDLCPAAEPAFAAALAAAGGPGAGASTISVETRAQLVALLKAGLAETECAICLSPIESPAITICRHIFCKPCIDLVIVRNKPACPMCRGPISPATLVELPPEEEEAGPSADDAGAAGGSAQSGDGAAGSTVLSAKMVALLERLRADAAAGAKSIVFSQFVSMLNLLAPALAAAGIAFARLDGGMTSARRTAAVTSFSDPAGPVVLLASLKAGGVGLNLTVASRVHLLDPWWSPAAEEQAMDRVHRLGQTKRVEVYRYAVEDSIEQRILLLQQQKRQLAATAFGRRGAEDARETRINDVRLLLDLGEGGAAAAQGAPAGQAEVVHLT